MIKNFEDYTTDKTGKVYSLKHNKKHELVKSVRHGYECVNLCMHGKYKTKRVHRLVAEEWVEIPEKYKDIPIENLVVDHINGDRTDNRAENLRWCTQQENNNFDLYRNSQSQSRRGNNYRSKKVLQKNNTGDVVNEWKSLKEASRTLEFDYDNLLLAIKNKRMAKGFYWEYD